MTLLALVDAVIQRQATVQQKDRATFKDVLDALYATRYTGRVELHFKDGQARALSLPNPVGVEIRNP